MTTDYNPIAEQYQRSKQQPWRTFVECFTLMDLIGDPTGLSVLDLACGEGFYTRLIRHRGAARVRGLDLSEGMIALAQAQEARQPLGVIYAVADARELFAGFETSVVQIWHQVAQLLSEPTQWQAGIADDAHVLRLWKTVLPGCATGAA